MQREKISNYSTNAYGRFWMKIPFILRTVLTGFGVSSLGVGIWVLLITYFPVPWSIGSMATILIVFWMYFSGRWKPSGTQGYRRLSIRHIKLRRPVWIWGLIAAFSIVLFLHWGFSLTFRIHEYQPEIFQTASYLNDYSPWMAWSIIIMASLVAGVCEEVGFRGYMQTPLELKYGPVAGISITSLVFVVVHLHQAWASGILAGIFAVSFIIGYLAYSTQSLLPGIMAHVSFDIVNFSYWWSDVLGTFDYKPISSTGIDSHFIITITVVILSIILFIVAIRKLLKLKEQSDLNIVIEHTKM